MDTALTAKLDRMRATFAPMRSVIVAFSGGVDSTFVLKVAHETLGDSVLALTTTSPWVGPHRDPPAEWKWVAVGLQPPGHRRRSEGERGPRSRVH